MSPEELIGKYVVSRESPERVGLVEYYNKERGTLLGRGCCVFDDNKTLGPSAMILFNVSQSINDKYEHYDTKEALLRAYPDDPSVIRLLTER